MGIAMKNLPRVLCPIFMFLLLAAAPLSAFAHAEFQGSTPPANALLDDLPTEVILRFSEPVGALATDWLLPDGTRRDATATAGPDGLSLSAPPASGRGTYVLNWRVVSADGHPIGGALVFSLGEATGMAPPDTPSSAVPAIIARFLAIMSMILALGATLYAAVVAPLSPGAARRGQGAALAAMPLALIALGAYGLDLLGRGSRDLLSLSPWLAAVTTPRGWGLLLGGIAALVAGCHWRNRTPVAFLALALGAVSLAVSGHASSGGARWIGQPLMAFHATALIFWIGGLPPLLAGLSRPDGLTALRRFSHVALPAVIVLVASGIGLVLIRGAGPSALIASDWGKLLALKLVLVACMLGLALWNKTRLTPAMAMSPDTAQIRLRRSIGAEIMLGALVLLVAMCFRLTPPPGSETASGPIYLHLHGSEIMADLEVSAAPPAAVSLSLTFADTDFGPLRPKEVSLTFNDPENGIGPIRTSAHLLADGMWQAGPVTLPTAGPWDIRIGVLITDFKQATLNGTLTPPNGDHP
ncbi:CopD family protein [Oceaniglobus trochenteri]|uniref:copper resistance CopC/CopD family protein n=1 Tax=Oceaniglobus trochenteri TaxID=2763260 RepID=UPI001CFF5F4D|nr:CopD family protein [Oceaniglobus trochenteri]